MAPPPLSCGADVYRHADNPPPLHIPVPKLLVVMNDASRPSPRIASVGRANQIRLGSDAHLDYQPARSGVTHPQIDIRPHWLARLAVARFLLPMHWSAASRPEHAPEVQPFQKVSLNNHRLQDQVLQLSSFPLPAQR